MEREIPVGSGPVWEEALLAWDQRLDTAQAQRAVQRFEEILTNYPDSKYVKPAMRYRDLGRERLSGGGAPEGGAATEGAGEEGGDEKDEGKAGKTPVKAPGKAGGKSAEKGAGKAAGEGNEG